MSTERQIKKAIKLSGTEKDLQDFIDSLPEMVEEVREIKQVLGSQIIKEALAKGNQEEADRHNPDKTYQRLYIRLKAMDHDANCRAIFKRKGVVGLQLYKKRVVDNFHYIKGKYPHLVPGTPEHSKELGFWTKVVLKAKSLFKK